MDLWLWGILSALLVGLLLLYVKAEIGIILHEDESGQGLQLRIQAPFYNFENYYDYSEPALSLPESFLLAVVEENIAGHQNSSDEYNNNYHLSSRGNGFFMPIWRFIKNRKMLRIMRGFTIVEELEWNSRMGSRDALHTGLNTGLCWAIKGSIVGFLSNYCHLAKVKLNVTPDFSIPAFASNLRCILKIRIVHIIIIGAYASAIKVRGFINGITARTARTSH